MLDQRFAILNLYEGAPGSLDELPFFLNHHAAFEQATSGSWLKRFFAKKRLAAAHRHRDALWRKRFEMITVDSPQQRLLAAMADGVALNLNLRRGGYVAARWAYPDFEDRIRLMRDEGVQAVLVLEPEMPIRSKIPSGYRLNEEFETLWRKDNPSAQDYLVIADLWDHPEVLKLRAQAIKEVLQWTPNDAQASRVLVIAGGLLAGEQNSALHQRIQRSFESLQSSVDTDIPFALSFLNPESGAKGIGPNPIDLLGQWQSQGVENIAVMGFSWLVDCMETLFDIDVVLGRESRSANMQFFRVPSINDSPEFIELLSALVSQKIQRLSSTSGGEA